MTAGGTPAMTAGGTPMFCPCCVVTMPETNLPLKLDALPDASQWEDRVQSVLPGGLAEMQAKSL